MSTGVVKWFNPEKGFGIATDEKLNKDVFIHHAEIEGGRPPMEGSRISYTLASAKGHFIATKIRTII